ncbi:MAG: YgfZ/GcvT domain-containing protein, partial [Gammaproteobacteria bacterium]
IVMCRQDNLHLLMERIHMRCKPGAPGGWELLDIEAGIPWITEATSESFLPQVLNLEEMQGLSYQKGCYPGQEVIARLHYRGELKRRLFLGTGYGEIVPVPGAGLERADAGARSGDVIDAARHPDGCLKLLAVADIHGADPGILRLQDAQQTSITLQALHYPLPSNT